jgi:hypothetical protein
MRVLFAVSSEIIPIRLTANEISRLHARTIPRFYGRGVYRRRGTNR